jgi:ABC-2 type transport system permease protein
MKLLEILSFEVEYRLRRPAAWLFGAVFIWLAFMCVTGMLVEESSRAGDLHANAPAGVAVGNIIISMFGLVVTAALFSGAALRDVETRMHPLFAASPITKSDYLGGRFIGALIVNLLLISVVPFALMFFLRPGFVDATLLGPFRLAAFLQPYVFFLLPNVFFTGSVLFAIAVLTRRSLPVFAGAAFLFISGLLIEEVVAEQMGQGALALLIEPFGFTVMSEMWEFWTPYERNTRLLVLEGPLLWNRLLWIAAGVLVLAFTRFRFRMEMHGARAKEPRVILSEAKDLLSRNGEDPSPSSRLRMTPGEWSEEPGVILSEAKDLLTCHGEDPSPSSRLRMTPVSPSFGSAARMRQFVAIAGQSFRELVFTRDFLLIGAGLVALVIFVGGTVADNFGTPVWPLTQILAPVLGGFFPVMVISLLTAFYAGELVWRERDAGMHDIADAHPVPDSVLFAGKYAALALMLVALQAVLMATTLALQVASGYFKFELGLYLQIVFGLHLTRYLLLAALAMLVHALVDNKYFGHLVVVVCFLFTLFANRFGLAHKLLVYGGDSGWVYSDLSGFGPFLGPVLWFRLYWAGWALLLAVLASLLWVRGRERGLRERLRLMRVRFNRTAAWTGIAAVLLIVGVGGYIFYNTNVLTEYRTPKQTAALFAQYERTYSKYEQDPQPTVKGTKLHVELYPERRAAHVRGTYALINTTAQPIRTVHLFLNPEVEHEAVAFDRPSRTVIADKKRGHHTYELARALEPGASMDLEFDVRFEPRGFPNDDPNTSVVQNGTYFDHTGGRNPNHRRWLPLVGYQPNRELNTERARREQGLPPRAEAASLDEVAGDGAAGREWITFEAVIGTSLEQTGVAPGTLRRTWTQNGRRYFHYAADKPVKNTFAIFSAEYAVHEETWKGVKIEIFHHPTHTFNVPRFARSARASLDYFTEHFGPYPHEELRLAEFPRYGSFAHAYPGTISYGEGFGWLTKVDEKVDFDLPSTVMAHEVAHQWWGYQVVPAPVQGAGVLSEVLAQYSALMVTEKIYGPEMVRRFLSNTRIEYLNRRGRAEHPEVPLLQVTNHANLVYRKGPLAMYALRHYIGEAQLNAALRRFLQKHGSGRAPYPTSRDLYRELKAATPAAYHYLLEDLLETITLWRLAATKVIAVPAGKGMWRVTLDVDAHKLRADGNGRETEAAMNDFIEIGVYEREENTKPLYLQKHRIRSGQQRITVMVKGEPGRAGIDPDLHLIDRNWGDNVRAVTR